MIRLDSNTRNIWFTSDTHFGHRKIMEFCNRPWKTLEEMDEGLIQRWNAVVGKEDIVFHLGDFAFSSRSKYREILSRLNGEIHLVLGNHDELRMPCESILNMFHSVSNKELLIIDGHYVYLNHEPLLCWGGMYREGNAKVINLHGHVHSGTGSTSVDLQVWEKFFEENKGRQYDVGVDNNDYRPVSWKEIKRIMYPDAEMLPKFFGSAIQDVTYLIQNRPYVPMYVPTAKKSKGDRYKQKFHK